MNTVIWDWNGTLLNDMNLCIASINILLKNRNLPKISIEKYREVFSFPVKDYYQNIGFDFEKEDFSVPAHQFIDLYYEGFESCSLQNSAVETLSLMEEKGMRQFVLSAMEQRMLIETLKQKGILHFFEGVAGLTDHYAFSKAEQGKKLIQEFNIEKENTWLIGDTEHDFEVASALGVHSILIADGHQSVKRLQNTKAVVIDNLKQLQSIL